MVNLKPEPEPRFAEDIYAADRARIKATNWGRVHVAADRREPVDILPGLGKYKGTRSRTEFGGFKVEEETL